MSNLYAIHMVRTSESIMDDVLAHHGIRGQKWGVKNGPPYPLSPDASERVRRRQAANDDFYDRHKKMERLMKARNVLTVVGATAALIGIGISLINPIVGGPAGLLTVASIFTGVGKTAAIVSSGAALIDYLMKRKDVAYQTIVRGGARTATA